ncbi:MAG TPA: hypothetical protein VGP47_07275 [Parachlamydiaceae bacterium]|nr:hypothetical protein [Parachlamydiaceae bacterium]
MLYINQFISFILSFYLNFFALISNGTSEGDNRNSEFQQSCEVKQGNVIYNFETGKLQCQSEINSTGEITILYKSLKDNTSIDFVRVGTAINPNSKKVDEVIVFLIRVEDENPICKSMTYYQEVFIPIDPKPVKEISLSGKTIYKSKSIHVVTP